MAISFIGSSHTSVTNGAAVTVTLPGLVEGDLVVAFGGHIDSTVDAGVSTAGYTEIADHSFSGDRFSVSYKFMGSTPDTTVTCHGSTTSGKGAVYAVMCFRGVDSIDPIDATTTTDTGNGNPNSPSITTATNNSAVLSLVMSEVSDSTVTAPTGYGDQINGRTSTSEDVTVGGAWKNKTTAGAEDPAAWSTFISGDWLSATVALKPLVLVTQDGVFSSVGTSAVAYTGGPLGEGILSVTATSAPLFIGDSLGTAETALVSTATSTVAFTGQGPQTNSPLISVGTSTVVFVGQGEVTDAPVTMTGTSSVLFKGASTSAVDTDMAMNAEAVSEVLFEGHGPVTDAPFLATDSVPTEALFVGTGVQDAGTLIVDEIPSTMTMVGTGHHDTGNIIATGQGTASFVGQRLGRVRDIHPHLQPGRGVTRIGVGVRAVIEVEATVSQLFQTNVFQDNVFQVGAGAAPPVTTGLGKGRTRIEVGRGVTIN